MTALFFDFGSKLSSVNFHASLMDDKIERNNLIKGEYNSIEFPVVFKQSRGKRINDIIDTGLVNLYLISSRFKKILIDNELTGWKTYPVIIIDKKDVEIAGYHGLSITGRSGPIFYDKSSLFEKRRVPNGPLRQFYKGEFVEDWDGSDFFVPDMTIGICVSNKAADVLKKNKITNMHLVNLSEIEVNLNLL